MTGPFDDDLEGLEVFRYGVASLSLRRWRADLIQGVTLRRLSNRNADTFDLGGTGESSPGIEATNWELFTRAVGEKTSVIVRMEQVHGGDIEAIDAPVSGPAVRENRTITVKRTDGLITGSAHIVLTARVADCVPVFLYDRNRGAIGLFHAGWRGTAVEIVRKGINRMKEEYGVSARDTVMYMGPSIGGSCYRVGDDVRGALDRWVDDSVEGRDRANIDLRDANRRQAIAEGVREENIFQSRHCTHCSRDFFFSFRASRGKCGRMVAFLGLRKQVFS